MATIVEWWGLNNNGTGGKGVYNLTGVGTPVYNATDVKEGTHKLGISSWNNTLKYSAAIIAAYAALPSHTTEFWYYQPAAGNIWRHPLLGGKTAYWYDDANSYGIAIRNDMNVHWFGFNGATQIGGVPSTGWHHISITWDGSTAKYYLDGALTCTRASQTTNPFSQITETYFLQGTNDGGGTNYGQFIDKVIFLSGATNGSETILPSTPTITDIDADNGPAYGGIETIITGTQFATGATVEFGGEPATDITVDSATQITCTTPAGTNGAVDVTVTNADTGTVTATGGYTYRDSAPEITEVDPAVGSTSGAQIITITGTEFFEGATVEFGGEPATDITVDSATQITCTTPAHSTGTVDVIITNTDTGTDTAAAAYEYIIIASGAIFEKNRLAAPGAWIILIELTMPDETVIHLCRNTALVRWRDTDWPAFPFEMDEIASNSAGEIPSLNIRVSNITREIQAALEDNGGAGGATLKIYIVHSDYLAEDEPVWQGDYKILSATADTKYVNFTCGLGYPLSSRRPRETWQKYICPFQYGDVRCGVTAETIGTFPACLKTLAQCQERENEARFGGELSIPGGYFG